MNTNLHLDIETEIKHRDFKAFQTLEFKQDKSEVVIYINTAEQAHELFKQVALIVASMKEQDN